MEHAESVTFGGSGLDRRAELRGTARSLLDDPRAGVIALWRGKPLVDGDGEGGLVRLPPPQSLLASADLEYLFLGTEDGAPVFAADLSGWTPEVVDTSALGSFVDTSLQRHPDAPAGTAFAELRLIMTRLCARDAELAATAKAVFGWHRSHRFCSACGAPSEMQEAGWLRSCPSCGTRHFPRTDPVVIMLITRGNRVLVGRSPGWPDGMYSLLAGFVEPGEPIEAAVRREVMEEAGITVGAVSYLASQPWPFPASLMFGCRGEALDDRITLDPIELDDACWVSREEMADVFAGRHPRIRSPRSGAIAHFLLRNWLADTLD